MTKKCYHCKKVKDISLFSNNKNLKYGKANECKKCVNEWGKLHYKKNKDRKIKYYYDNKKELLIAKIKYRKSPNFIYSSISERRNNVEVKFTRKEFIEWHNNQEKKCGYCDITEEEYKLMGFKYMKNCKRLTIDRKDNNLPYILNNLILACPLCNMIKNSFFSYDEMKQISQSFIKPKWQILIKSQKDKESKEDVAKN